MKINIPLTGKRERCKFCGDKLNGVSPMGLCGLCAAKELKETKKYFLRSTICGALLFLVVFAVISIIKANHLDVNAEGIMASEDIILINVIAAIPHISLQTQIIIYLICFVIPFGRFVRYKASAANVEHGGTAGCAVILLELLISLVSGPFYIVFNIYKLIKLSKFPYD